MFGRLMPGKARFFEHFNELAEEIVQGSRGLYALLANFDDLEPSPAPSSASVRSRGFGDTPCGRNRTGLDTEDSVFGFYRRGRMVLGQRYL